MKNKHKSHEVLLVESDRIARLESDMEHTQGAVDDIKIDIREIKDSSKNVEIAVIKLAQIAEHNQRVYPRIENLEKLVDCNKLRLASWGGGIAVLLFCLTFFGNEVKTAIKGPTKSPIVQDTHVNLREPS